MTKRRTRRLLWTTTAAAAAGSVLAIGLAMALPLDLPIDDVPPSTPPGLAKSPATDGIPSQAELEKVSAIDLGHDIVATATPGIDAAQSQIAQPDLHVIGTILEPGHCMAMLTGPDGKTIFLRVGDQIEGARIAAIAIDSVTVEIGGKPTILKVEKPPPVPDAVP